MKQNKILDFILTSDYNKPTRMTIFTS